MFRCRCWENEKAYWTAVLSRLLLENPFSLRVISRVLFISEKIHLFECQRTWGCFFHIHSRHSFRYYSSCVMPEEKEYRCKKPCWEHRNFGLYLYTLHGLHCRGCWSCLVRRYSHFLIFFCLNLFDVLQPSLIFTLPAMSLCFSYPLIVPFL